MQADPKRWVASYNSRPSIFTVCVSWVTQQMAGGAGVVRLVELDPYSAINKEDLRAAVEAGGSTFCSVTWQGGSGLVCYGLVGSNRCMLLQSTH